DGEYDRLPALAADLAQRQVTVITANGPAVMAAKATTTTIPIVFSGAGDPVKLGLVASLNRPGGNLTGVTTLNTGLTSKRLQLLHELTPTATVMALLINPTNSSAEAQARELEAAARAIGVQFHVLPASIEPDIDALFTNLVRVRTGGL